MLLARRALAALLSTLLVTLALPLPVLAQSQTTGFKVEAKSAILYDLQSETVLLEQNPDEPIAPASLTKLMTLWLAMKAIRDGRLRPDERVIISQNAWYGNGKFPPGASGMFLEPGQQVTVDEILKGIAIVSGNDACVALAEHMAGSVDAFVAMMKEEAEALGLRNTRFVDPHGLSESNVTSARDMLRLARIYLENFPENLAKLHSQKEFTYPLPHNLSEHQKGRGDTAPRTQKNYNDLLFDPDIKVDGLKTGYIASAGYNFIVTATEGERRLLGVILGAPSREARAAQGKALLLWGFRNFANVTPLAAGTTVGEVRVWKGRTASVAAVPARAVTLSLPKGDVDRVHVEVNLEPELIAPVPKGQPVGTAVFKVGDREVGRVPVVTAQEVPKGSWWQRLLDTIRLFFRSVLQRGR